MNHPDRYNYTVDITHQNSMEWYATTLLRKEMRAVLLYESFTVPCRRTVFAA